ncbi:hypothetical protein TL16_g07457 [Triparma laevis f. inornata]|uniref:Endonuclease/exonuclease/phosphatase domain-containing protein n=1 Tax=Triparma laevis f. inornata TaxID=1714386 RepID=A0A9W7B048_9STRA|nr:hypothetical protein TL16_g07457 [Triparma laevis f. inornata]
MPGGRNAYNIALVKNSSAGVFALFVIGFGLSDISNAGLCVLLVLLALPLSVIVAQPCSMFLSAVIFALKRDQFSEFKKERIDMLFDEGILQQYDVITVQELYGGWFVGSRYYQNYMKDVCKKAGLGYSCFAGRPKLPRILFDQGLAIFSRHPIMRSKRHVFSRQSIWDYMFVSRASLYAEVAVGDSGIAHVFTLHTAPSLDDMKKRTKLASLLAERGSGQRAVQVHRGDGEGGGGGEGRTGVTVVMGDFNIRAGEGDYNYFSENLGSEYGLVDITKKKDGGWDSTFGVNDKNGKPVETLLTSPGLRGKPQTLDFIFTDAKPLQESRVLLLENKDESTRDKFQCVSDHLGLESVVEVTVDGRTKR